MAGEGGSGWAGPIRPDGLSPGVGTSLEREWAAMTIPRVTLERAVLLSPDPLARAAAQAVTDRMQQWMLNQPWAVRVSFAREALNGDERDQMIWMLRQPDAVRMSFLEEVVEAGGVPADEKDQTSWMLRQSDPVRATYLREVLHVDPDSGQRLH
jgi:hypothetical protein